MLRAARSVEKVAGSKISGIRPQSRWAAGRDPAVVFSGASSVDRGGGESKTDY
jgi:hypothetical protein